MAFVTRFEPEDRDFRSLHPTQVVCRYLLHEVDGNRILQLNTYGSDGRENPEKLSQTLQLNEASAKDLLALLQKEFG